MKWLVVAVAAFIAVASAGVQKDCTWETDGVSGGKWYYNLSPMTHAEGEADYLTIFDTETQNTFFVNICGNATASCVPRQAVCQQGQNTALYACGLLSTQTFSDPGTGNDGQSLIVWYGGGKLCGSVYRSTTITVMCDESAGRGAISEADESSCTYALTVRSKYGCGSSDKPSSGGIDVGWILIIVALCLVIVYIVAGVCYNKFLAHKEGIELIPNKDFWFGFPILLKDGVMWAIKGFPKTGYATEYSTL